MNYHTRLYEFKHRRDLGKGQTLFHYFFFLRTVVLAIELNWVKLLKNGECGGRWCTCMYIKNWFKPIFAFFLTRLRRKLKFPIPMVYFATPPPPLTPMPLNICNFYIPEQKFNECVSIKFPSWMSVRRMKWLFCLWMWNKKTCELAVILQDLKVSERCC
jgi:hypothetical protein